MKATTLSASLGSELAAWFRIIPFLSGHGSASTGVDYSPSCTGYLTLTWWSLARL
jgi:hypothetical protein